MSGTERALKPFVENSSSAAVRIASRKFGLREAPSWLRDLRTIFVLSYKRSGHVSDNLGRWYGRRWHPPKRKRYGSAQGMLSLSKTIGHLIAGAALLLTAASAQAETFPNKPVHILVPYAAGGAVDVLARTLCQALAKVWGQHAGVGHRPGAGGVVAAQAPVRS